jgi:hypothetical protein
MAEFIEGTDRGQLSLLPGSQRKEIRLAGERTKNSGDHIIPLSVVAQALIETFLRVAGSKFVFTTTGDTSISGWSRAKGKSDEIMLAELEARKRSDGDDQTEIKPGVFTI